MALSVLTSPKVLLASFGAALGLAILAACSSSTEGPTSPISCTSGTTVACTCADGQTGTTTCGTNEACQCASGPDGGGASDAAAGTDSGHNGDGGHLDDGATPTSLYGQCALDGGFGWPCIAPATGPDPADCTDPNYPICFVGGQGTWCTKACPNGASDCTTGTESTGCVPTACNGRGYCK